VEATHKTRQRYWGHWVNFIPPGLDLYLQDVDGNEQLMVLQAFA